MRFFPIATAEIGNCDFFVVFEGGLGVAALADGGQALGDRIHPQDLATGESDGTAAGGSGWLVRMVAT